MTVTIDPAAIEELQKSLREVALRADRLRKWVAVGELLRALDSGYASFYRWAKGQAGQAPDWAQLDDYWSNTLRGDLLYHLFDYIRSDMAEVRTPLARDPGHGDEIDGWARDMETAATQLQQALAGFNAGELRTSNEQLHSRLKQLLVRQKGIVERDIAELCLLTTMLKDRLGA